MGSYTRPYRKEGKKYKLTLYFNEERDRKIQILMKKNTCSRASQVEDMINPQLDRMKI